MIEVIIDRQISSPILLIVIFFPSDCGLLTGLELMEWFCGGGSERTFRILMMTPASLNLSHGSTLYTAEIAATDYLSRMRKAESNPSQMWLQV